MRFSIIVATNKNNGIGKKETIYPQNESMFYIPWNSTVDMIFFRDKTTKTNNSNKLNAVIMGKNTYFSLPERNNSRCLKNRCNIVISKHPNLFENDKSVKCFSSLDLALDYCLNNKNIENTYVIGGAALYQEALNDKRLENIFINVINKNNEDCNIYFPINLFESKKEYYCNDYEMKKFNSDEVEFHKFTLNYKNYDEDNYLDLLKNILENGDERQTRNSITRSIFGERLSFDLKEGFPLLTTKKMFLRGIFEELIWFFKGCTDSKVLEEKKVNIWKGNTTKEFIESVNLPYREGDVGNMYGFQWIHAGAEYKGCDEDYSGKGFNQIEYCLDLLKKDKNSRRILMTTYVPHEASKGVLYPCHGLTIQWYVRENDGINYLSCHMYQRSADMFLGVPFNISSYALMCYMFCHVLNNDNNYEGMPFKPDKLIMSFGDLHIYKDHYEQVEEQINRKSFKFPQIKFRRELNKLEDFTWEDVEIINYNSCQPIKASMIA